MGTGTGEEVETQEEEEDNHEQDDFEYQINLYSSNHENGASINRETGSSDRFGVFRTKNKTIDGSQQSREFVTMSNSEVQPEKSRNTGPSNPSADPEVDYEETSRQRGKTRTSTELPGTDRLTPPLVTPLVDNGASIEEVLTSTVDSIGEQNEQMS